jgi:hypothetical protein
MPSTQPYQSQLPRTFEIAGPRERIYFDPEKTVAALVNCGRGLRESVIGIPKTIDNDIEYLDKSFGLETAFAKVCLVPEVPFSLEGPSGFLETLGRRIILRKHAVVWLPKEQARTF